MSGKKKIRRNVPRAVVHVLASFNNTIVTFTDPNGGTTNYQYGGIDPVSGNSDPNGQDGLDRLTRAIHSVNKQEFLIKNGVGKHRVETLKVVASRD